MGRSPFVVLYGYEPRYFGIDISRTYQSPDLQDWLADRELMQQLVHQRLLRAQSKMRDQADKNRSDRVFQINDLVYLKAQPYV